MHRTKDPREIRSVIDHYPDHFGFPVETWLLDDRNVCLKEGENVTFGEWKSEGNYFVHFCFHTARGRYAIELTKEMFSKFCQDFPVKTAVGLILVSNKKARWAIRQVGFESLGIIETKVGTCEMFYSTNTHKET